MMTNVFVSTIPSVLLQIRKTAMQPEFADLARQVVTSMLLRVLICRRSPRRRGPTQLAFGPAAGCGK